MLVAAACHPWQPLHADCSGPCHKQCTRTPGTGTMAPGACWQGVGRMDVSCTQVPARHARQALCEFPWGWQLHAGEGPGRHYRCVCVFM